MKNIEHLSVNLYKPLNNIKDTTIIFTHGLAEYSKSYIELATYFQNLGYYVITYDLLGHGKTKGKKGYVKYYTDFLEDLDNLVNFAYTNTSKVFLYGHSLGGVITNLYNSLYNKVDGAIITASPTYIVKELKMLRPIPKFFINKIKIKTNFKDPLLTHNYKYLVDEYDIEFVYLRLVIQVMIKGMKVLLKNKENYQTPILMIYSNKDQLVSLDSVKEFYKEIPTKDKKLIIYNESLHNIHLDIEKDKLKEDITKWLEKRV